MRTAAKLSVLVVDDDQDIREYLQDFLSAEGFEVTTLADPTLAVERIRDEVFHLVVLDLMMPKISGLDLLAQIRAVDDDIAVIILTGYPSLETATASIQHEVSAYIHKPFTPAEFRDVIARIAKKKGLVLRREDELHADDRPPDPRPAQGARPDAQADGAAHEPVGVAALADRARRVERVGVEPVQGRDRARRPADRPVRRLLTARRRVLGSQRAADPHRTVDPVR